ncbi:MAG: quinolinate synthase NadA [Desulfovibrionaceae bacterium]|nr:quinolinate synthase NadA [Desulfovibrionaceae bacterium]
MNDISSAIIALKKQMGSRLCIMGHHYQHDSVVRHCDITGDSLELARRVDSVAAASIVFCGVYFMGESAALLAKTEQSVYLPEPDADCMMALMARPLAVRNVLKYLNSRGRRVLPLAYVNTSLALKAVVGEYGGAVCTSANAETMLRWALQEADAVLFLPDKHLGRNTARKLGIPAEDWHILRCNGRGLLEPESQPLDRRLLLWPGCCAIHARLKERQVEAARAAWPGCHIAVHPECRPEIVESCDGAGSTSYLIREAERMARENPGSTLIIGTENNLVERLAARHAAHCRILPLGQAYCPHMARVTEGRLLDTLTAIAAQRARPVRPAPELCASARLSLHRMLEVCGQ